MYLNEVLQLDKTASSIKKIDVFLVSCNKKSLDYYKAFAYRNIILHSLGKTNEALKALYSLSQEFSKLGDAEIISICDAIIEITLEVKRFDQARKFMDEKKKHLRVSNALLNTKDEIRLALARKDYGRAISELKIFLGEILTTDEYAWGYESLAEVYYIVRDFKSYLEIVPELEKIYQDTLNTNDLIKLHYRKLEIAYTEGNYVKVICEGNRFLNDFDLDDERMLSVAALLLECYIHSKDYRKASIIESNYEAKLSTVSNETALAFCKAGLKLYTETSSLVSMKHYQDLIDKYSQTKKKIKGKQDSSGIIIPTVKPVEEVKLQDSLTPPMLHELTKDIHPVYVSQNYTKLEQLFLILNNTDDAIKFREVYRQALIELSSFIPFEEAFLLYFDRSYLGLHYKKERAYDKRLEYNEIMDTMNYLAIGQEQEIILDRTSTFGLQNIVSKTYYENVPYGIAIPLFKDGVAYASIAFWAQEPFLDKELVYETLKLISQMLNKSLIAELRQTEIRNSNKRMFFIYENMSSGIKELMEGHIHLSSQAKEILGSLEDIQEADFKSHIHAADLARYENLVDEIYHYFSTNQSIEYRYKKNNEYIDIKETFFPSYENGFISLYSIIEDNTRNVKNKENLYQIAYTNPVSKLETEIKLLMDLEQSMVHRKLSLAVFDVHDFKLYEQLYGLNLSKQLIYAIAVELKEYFSTNFQTKIYHLEFDRYALLILDTNDKRTMENILNKAFSHISEHINLVNNRIKLYFNCGIYRLSKSTNLDDPNKILEYAYDALSIAKQEKTLEHHIVHYDSEASKVHFNENQLVTHISESIDHGRLGISYKQLVSLEKKEVYGYVANVSLDNYEVDYSHMKRVIQRRRLEEQIDKYVVSSCAKELRMLSEYRKAVIPILVSLTKDTMSTNIIGFIEAQQNFYKSCKYIIFYYEPGAKEELLKLKQLGYMTASSNIMDVYQKRISHYIHNLEVYGFSGIEDIIELCKQQGVTFILSNVSSKEELLKATTLGVNYVYGNYYKKSIRMKKVIEKLA